MNRALALQPADVSAYPSLPPEKCRADVERMIRRCGHSFGLSKATIGILIAMMDYTRPRDWTSGTAAPVCFASQTRVAEAASCSTRTIRNAEVALEDIGDDLNLAPLARRMKEPDLREALAIGITGIGQ